MGFKDLRNNTRIQGYMMLGNMWNWSSTSVFNLGLIFKDFGCQRTYEGNFNSFCLDLETRSLVRCDFDSERMPCFIHGLRMYIMFNCISNRVKIWFFVKQHVFPTELGNNTTQHFVFKTCQLEYFQRQITFQVSDNLY